MELGCDFRAPPTPEGRVWGQWQAKAGPSCARMPPSDLNKACGNAMDAHEAAQMHQNFSQQLLQDHIEACSLPEHKLITVRAQSGEDKTRVLVCSSGPAHLAYSVPQCPGRESMLPEEGSAHLAALSLYLSNSP